VWHVHDGRRHELSDPIAVEEPLEIRIAPAEGSGSVPLTVTMRTPGDDADLAAGLLYAEGVIERAEDLLGLRVVADAERPGSVRVEARLRAGLGLDPARDARRFVASAACGVCGKTSIDAVLSSGFGVLDPERPRVAGAVLEQLPERMRAAQEGFSRTGGLHAAALFDAHGSLRLVREDVGRHNAVDKVVGALLRAGELPARDDVLLVSGRAGFEIAQKAIRAGIPVLAAVGAPSSLGLRLAARAGMTLVGFLRPHRFNLYTGPQRIRT
jgi:FdhD protein